MLTVNDIVAALTAYPTAMRQTLFEQLKARWCIHCGREREKGATGCDCGKAFDEAERKSPWEYSEFWHPLGGGGE